MEKRTRVRFTYEDDLALFREFLAQNPLENPDGWEVIKKHLAEITGKIFSIRTIKNHLQLLIDLFLKKDLTNTKKSGTEEIYSERDHLLQEISDICKETNLSVSKKRKTNITKEKQVSLLGNQTREKLALAHAHATPSTSITRPTTPTYLNMDVEISENLGDSVLEDHDYGDMFMDDLPEVSPNEIEIDLQQYNESTTINLTSQIGEETKENSKENVGKPSDVPVKKKVLGPSRRRTNKSKPLRRNALEYLEAKNTMESKIKLKELGFEDRKIELEERKVNIEERKVVLLEKKTEIEILERQQKIELEKENLQLILLEKKNLNHVISSQQVIIETLLKRLERYENA